MAGLLDIGIDAAKRSFFDRAIVARSMNVARLKVGSKFGAYVRRRARSSMRKSRQLSVGEMSAEQLVTWEEKKRYALKMGFAEPKRPMAGSRPGEPPRVILGFLKQFLFFAWDNNSKSVVIGPAKLNGKTDAPHTLEAGGNVTLPNGKSVEVKARPYMKPSFRAELPGVPALWANAMN